MTAASSRHRDALRVSGMLSELFRTMYRKGAAMVRPQKVIRVLTEAGVKFVLMGTHGVGGYRSQPRATQDVDVLIRARDHRKAVAAIHQAFPKLIVRDHPPVTRFVDPATDQSMIDLMRPVDPLDKLAFRHCVAVNEEYLIPSLELALASKFAAMTSPNRDEDKRLTDAGDFVNIVRGRHAEIDQARLRRLGERVHAGGGDEIVGHVTDVAAGRRLRI